MRALLILLILLGGAASPALAACDSLCGTTMAQGTATAINVLTLTKDLDCTTCALPKSAITLNAYTKLDCAGFSVLGPKPGGPSGDIYGIRADGKIKPKVDNCRVTGFTRGLYFTNNTKYLVDDSTFEVCTQYGAMVSGGSGRVLDTTVRGNGDEGLHVSNVGPGTTIANITAENNAAEGVYILDSDSVSLANITCRNNGLACLYIDTSPNTTLVGLWSDGDYVHVFGPSDDTTLTKMSIVGARVKVQKDGLGIPHNVMIKKACVYDPPSEAFNLDGVCDLAVNNPTLQKIKNSAILFTGTPAAAARSVKAVNNSCGNIVNLYMPQFVPSDIQAGSTFNAFVTWATAPPFSCWLGE